MFFIGSTGPLLTLLLTVLLPAILFTAKHNVTVEQDSAIESSCVQNSIQYFSDVYSTDLLKVKNESDFYCDITYVPVHFKPQKKDQPFLQQKIYCNNILVTHSGNKAPPSLKNLLIAL